MIYSNLSQLGLLSNETSQLKNVVNNSTAGLRDYFNCKKKDEMDVSLKISPSYLLKFENMEIQAGKLFLHHCLQCLIIVQVQYFIAIIVYIFCKKYPVASFFYFCLRELEKQVMNFALNRDGISNVNNGWNLSENKIYLKICIIVICT